MTIQQPKMTTAYNPFTNPANYFNGTEKSVIVANLTPEYQEPHTFIGRSWWKELGYDYVSDIAFKEAYKRDCVIEERIQKKINKKKDNNKRWLRSDTKCINYMENQKYFGDQIDWFYNCHNIDATDYIGYIPYYKYSPCRPYETIRDCNGKIVKFIKHYE